MSVVRFVDTNILLYAHDLEAPAKRARSLALAEEWIANGDQPAVSVQVLQELHYNLVRRGKSFAQAGKIVRGFYDWTVVENNLALLEAAFAAQERWKVSLWDALILAAAKGCGAQVLVSEDFNHGQDYGGVRAWNPYASS